MNLLQHHIVGNTLLDVRVEEESNAIAWQSTLDGELVESIQRVMGEVFDCCSTPDHIHRFDSIDLDLGVIAIDACRQELPERLRQTLTAYLSERIPLHNSATRADSACISDVAQLQHYLQHGYLPYNGNHTDDQSIRHLWNRVTSLQRRELVEFLVRGDAIGIMAERLRKQLPSHAVDTVLDDVRWKRSGLPLDVTTLKTELWRSMRMGAPYAVATHWSAILKHRAQLVLECLRSYCSEAEVLRRIAHTFPQAMILDMIVLLEPTERDFLRNVLKHPEVFDASSRYRTGHEASSVKESRCHLYEFTLTYLLVERGSRFNRKEYLRSIISRMASHGNSSFGALITSITEHFQVQPSATRMHTDVLKLLFELQEEEQPDSALVALPYTRVSDNAPQHEVIEFSRRLARALGAGDVDGIVAVWPAMLATHPAEMGRLLADHGREAAVRHMMAMSFSEVMLQDTIRLLEPYNAGFIIAAITHTMHIPHRESESSAGEGNTRRPLYEFTLTYLLSERGGRFNRKEYMRSMLHRMAAHENTSFLAMVRTIAEAFLIAPPANRLHSEILALISELHDNTVIGPEGDLLSESRFSDATSHEAISELRRQLSRALGHRRIHQIEALWSMLLQSCPSDVRQMLVDHGQGASMRRYISRTFPLSMLHDVIRLLEPYEAPFIFDVIDHGGSFKQAVGHDTATNTGMRQTLYEFTLAFLMVERGGMFNKTMYLDSLIRRLADHENMRYAELLHSLASIFENVSVSDPQSRLGRILAKLMDNAQVTQRKSSAGADSFNALLPIYERYDDLLATMLPGTISSRSARLNMQGSEISDCLKNLGSCYPALILQLFAELQKGFNSFAIVLSGLPASVLEQLIASFIAAGVAGPDINKDAVADILQQSRNRQETLRSILVSLIKQRPLETWKRHAFDAPEQLPGQPAGEISFTRETPQLSRNLSDELEGMLHKPVFELHRWVEYNIVRHGLRRLCSSLGDHILARLVEKGAPADAFALLQYADIMTAAITDMQAKLRDATPRSIKWQFILMYLFEQGRRFAPREFVIAFAAYMAGLIDFDVPAESTRQIITALGRIGSVSEAGARDAVIAILKQHNGPGAATAKPLPGVKSNPREETPDTDESTYEEEVFIANAGLVLTAPFLPRLFSMLNMLDNNAFKDCDTAERAVHLLQYVANTRTDSPEYQLVLNKLMCGVKNREPICCGISISDEEIQATEGMLAGMLAHWKILGNTSITGLRESFLQRDGCLQLRDNAWNLQVEKKAYDMLLDQAPWAFSTIKYPWMERVIHVHWN